jgi:hypothetical protein
MRIGLYADSGGEPGALIATTEAKTFTATGSGHWQEFTFTSALGLAHAAALHSAFVGARQRGRCTALCPSRANAQDGKDVAAQHRRRGHAHPLGTRCQHSHDRRRRDRGPCRQQPKLRRLGAERALHDRSADQRSIWWRINQAPVSVGHVQHRRSYSVRVTGSRKRPRRGSAQDADVRSLRSSRRVPTSMSWPASIGITITSRI